MPAPANLVHQQSQTTGTGNFTLAAVNGRQSFSSAFGIGGGNDKFDYFIGNQGAAEWERGTGHLLDASTLVRDTVLESSNSNLKVNFTSGTKDVINDVPAAKQYFAGGPNIVVGDGGTGAATFTTNGVLFGNTTSAIQATAQGAANTVLTANAGAPAFSAAPTIGTSVTTPLIIGGTAAGSTLILESTSGVGSGDLITLKTGSQVEALRVDTSQRVIIGGAGNQTSSIFQVLGTDNNATNVAVACYNSGQAQVKLLRSNNAALGGQTAVAANNNLGVIQAYGSDGSVFQPAGNITFTVDGIVSAGNVPNRITFSTVAVGGGTTQTEVLRIDSTGDVVVGGVAALTDSAFNGDTLYSGREVFQVLGTGGATGIINIRFDTSGNPAKLVFGKSHTATVGGQGAVLSGEVLGALAFVGSDGTTFDEAGAFTLQADFAAANGSVPGRLILATSPVGTNTTPTEALRIDSSQRVGIGGSPSHLLDLLKAGTNTIAPLRFASGTNLTTAAAGVVEFDGTAFYHTSVASSRQVVDTEQVQVLSGTYTLTANGNAQPLFNATLNGAITLAATTTYEFEMVIAATGFSGSAHTLNLGFALGGSLASIGYYYEAQTGSTLAGPTASASGFVATSTATAICASTTTTGLTLFVRGIIRASGAGTFTPQLTQVTNNAAAVIQANSFFRCWPIGSSVVTNVGNWS